MSVQSGSLCAGLVSSTVCADNHCAAPFRIWRIPDVARTRQSEHCTEQLGQSTKHATWIKLTRETQQGRVLSVENPGQGRGYSSCYLCIFHYNPWSLAECGSERSLADIWCGSGSEQLIVKKMFTIPSPRKMLTMQPIFLCQNNMGRLLATTLPGNSGYSQNIFIPYLHRARRV